MDYDKIDIKNKLVRVTCRADRKVLPFKNQNYQLLKQECLKNGRVFEDPEFPTLDRSMFYTQSVPRGTKWKRPAEICTNPVFIYDEVNSNDLDQGYLGNCNLKTFLVKINKITF